MVEVVHHPTKNPALATDAVFRGYKKPQQRSQTPSGGKGQPKQCDWCGKHNGCKGEKGTCPTLDKECGICHGWNHYKAVCRKAAQMQGARGGTQQKMGKGSSHSLAKQRPNTMLTLWCLRWSFQQKGNFQIRIKQQFKTQSLQKQVDL